VLPPLLGAPLHDRSGTYVGTVAGVAVDATRRPAWLALDLPGGGHGLVPAGALVACDDGLRLPALAAPPVPARPGVLPAGPALAALRRHFAVLGPAGPPAAWLHAPRRVAAAA
jgi:hypothetical protein